MKHLTPDQMLDLAERAVVPDAAEHLAACAACRAQVESLRSVMSVAAVDRDAQTFEPSPLFWEHLSARVHEAVRADAAQRLERKPWVRLARPAAIAAAALATILAVAVMRTPGKQGSTPAPTPVTASLERVDPDDHTFDDLGDDPSWILVADLGAAVDWDTAAAAGIALDSGAADHALLHMSDEERQELQRLLSAELARGRS